MQVSGKCKFSEKLPQNLGRAHHLESALARIGILWPEIRILRRAGDGHALEVSLACRSGLALDAIRWRGRCRWGMSPPGRRGRWGKCPWRPVNVFMRPVRRQEVALDANPSLGFTFGFTPYLPKTSSLFMAPDAYL